MIRRFLSIPLDLEWKSTYQGAESLESRRAWRMEKRSCLYNAAVVGDQVLPCSSYPEKPLTEEEVSENRAKWLATHGGTRYRYPCRTTIPVTAVWRGFLLLCTSCRKGSPPVHGKVPDKDGKIPVPLKTVPGTIFPRPIQREAGNQ